MAEQTKSSNVEWGPWLPIGEDLIEVSPCCKAKVEGSFTDSTILGSCEKCNRVLYEYSVVRDKIRIMMRKL